MAKSSADFDITGLVVRSNGMIDIPASKKQFDAALSSLMEEEKEDEEVLSKAISQAFAKGAERGANNTLRMETVLHYALENLNVADQHHAAVRKQIQEFIRRNPQRYPISKGKGGGVTMASKTIPSASPATASAPPPSASALPSFPPSARLSNAPKAQ